MSFTNKAPAVAAELPTLSPGQLARARSGEFQAFEPVYRAFARPVFNLAVRLCGTAEAGDVMQETFVTAHLKIAQYRGEGSFWGWLRRIAVNHCLMRLRSAQRWSDEEPAAQATGLDLPARLDLEEAFRRLPAMARTVVWLHDVEGMTHREIAALTGRTTSFSKSQLSRAHRRLRRQLGHEGDPCSTRAM